MLSQFYFLFFVCFFGFRPSFFFFFCFPIFLLCLFQRNNLIKGFLALGVTNTDYLDRGYICRVRAQQHKATPARGSRTYPVPRLVSPVFLPSSGLRCSQTQVPDTPGPTRALHRASGSACRGAQVPARSPAAPAARGGAARGHPHPGSRETLAGICKKR